MKKHTEQITASLSHSFVFSTHTRNDVLEQLRTSESGLSRKEAARRLKLYGSNTIEEKKKFVWLHRIIRQLKDPVVLVLLIAGILLLLIGPDYRVDAYFIFIALVINLIVSVLQEGKVSRAFALLRNANPLRARVMRDGMVVELPSESLVPGDIVYLSAGSKVPADTRLLWEDGLKADESVLTGEWEPVSKQAVALTNERPIQEQVNMIWKGTTIVDGKGRGVVVTTAMQTMVGRIAEDLHDAVTETPLQKQIRKLARLIMQLVFVAVFLIIVIALLQNVPLVEITIVAIAIAIAGIPSGLPAAITVVLVVGMQTVLRRNGLVRNLLAAETLGSTTWVLSDKTGTLTKGEMSLAEVIFADTSESIDVDEPSPRIRGTVLGALLATDGRRFNTDGAETVLNGTPIEKAIVLACEEVCEHGALRDTRAAYIPFSSKTRYSSALVRKSSGGFKQYIVGAPETILEKSERVKHGTRTQALTTAERTRLEEKLMHEAEKGRRVIAIATAAVKPQDTDDEDALRLALENNSEDLTFLAFLSFEDGIREDVPEAIKHIRKSHVTVSMVTGDNQHTALQIAREAGIVCDGDAERVILGSDIATLTDEELFTEAQHVRVFARMLPSQKSRLLRVLLEHGEVVAMTGDGINDAPALHHASIGIAVSSGTDVAKESSDLILLNNSFSTITASITEGKKIILNLKKIVIYLLSTSFSEAILVAGGLLMTAALPITPVQILWANIVEEAFIAFTFAFEKEHIDLDKSDPRDPENSSIISKRVRQIVILLAILVGIFLLVIYHILATYTTLSIEQIQTVMFLVVSIDSIFLALSFKSLNRSIFVTNPFSNLFLFGAIVISIGIMVMAFITPFLSNALGLVPLPLWAFMVIPISAVYHIIVVEGIKYVLFQRKSRSMPPVS